MPRLQLTQPLPTLVVAGAAAALTVGGVLAYWTVAPTRRARLRTPKEVGAQVSDDDEKDEDLVPQYDFVIVGSGVGLVLANRLSESGEFSVLVLEAGQSGSLVSHSVTPWTFRSLIGTKHDWMYRTVPQAAVNGREMPWPRTKLVGGCTSGNAMMFHNGAPEDYDRWADMQRDQGGEGWNYAGMKKYLRKFEKFNPHPENPIETTERGRDGPMETGYFGYFSLLGNAFKSACDALGIKAVDDLNTSRGTLGVSRTQTYIDARGRRVSTESAYLTPAVLARPNLKVAVGAHVTKVRFDTLEGQRPRAVGVEFGQSKGGPVYVAKARKEVILSAGAIGSPCILMLSGIGPAAELAEHGLSVMNDLPGVGKHLMDHLMVSMCFAINPRIKGLATRSLVHPNSMGDKIKVFLATLQYRLSGKGILTMHSQDCMSYMRVGNGHVASEVLNRPAIEYDSTNGPNAPDMEIMVSSYAWKDPSLGPFEIVGEAMSITPVSIRPTSLGEVRLRSADPWDQPVIDPKYLTTQRDMETLIRGVRLSSIIAHTEPLALMLNTDDTSQPILDHSIETMSDEEVEELIKHRAETIFHPTSTTRMAPLEHGGVVDTRLKVYGVDGLRVVDAGIMPTISSGHTAGAALAIAEKAAELILAEA